MYMTCKCLNVSIKTRGSDLGSFNRENAEFDDIEKADEFFNGNLATAVELDGITKEQSGLVESRNVGSWIVNRCLNCSMHTHAVHKLHGAALVLINTELVMSPDKIQQLKTNSNYSSIFRIIIEHSVDDNSLFQVPTKYSVSQLSNNLQLALTNLQQQLEQSVQRKSAETEGKIRAFTAEQYQLLEEFRERIHTEYRVLMRKICGEQEKKAASSNVQSNIPITEKTTANFHASPIKSVNATTPVKSNEFGGISESTIGQGAAIKNSFLLNGATEEKDKVQKTFPTGRKSFDAEALFSLEGMDDSISQDPSHPSEDESDTDAQEEGIHIPRALRGGHPTLAKSLPVSVPNFSSYVRRTIQDQDDDPLPRDSFDPHNIRASIKALAKSVHGDTVFGDLPRPRFSTQI